ncbi:MAG: DUF1292 domain-containing protein [Lachnospiraceae bacterium]|nr:DUF1292 domain-containing protein [Lachnospiraceae bacterium]
MTQKEIENTTVDIDLDEGTVTCEIVCILKVNGKDYIYLLPTNSKETPEGDVWIYGYTESASGEPDLIYIEDDDEYEQAADAFDEYLDNMDFDELDD